MQKLVNSDEMLPKPREYFINKALKLKAMLSSSFKGEQEAAEHLLADLMQKNNITWKDLDDSIEQEYVMPCENEYHKRLLIQCTYKVVGSGHCYRMFSSSDKEHTKDVHETEMMKIKVKPCDFLTIKLDWEFFYMKFKEELDIFYRAFIEQNNLFPPEELQREDDIDDNEDLSEKDMKKIRGMMTGIDSYTRYEMILGNKEEVNSDEKD